MAQPPVVAGSPTPAPSASIPYCGPQHGQTSDAWHQEMLAFRAATRAAANVSGTFCNASDLFGRNAWASATFVWPLTMMMDRLLYDEVAHAWTVDRYLADVRARYGGVDGVLLWQSYTNMGVDARNQIDLLRVAPGGLRGVRELIAQFHARNVSVIFPWNQWAGNYSNSQREEPDFNFTRVLALLGADGFNADSAGLGSIPGEPSYSPRQENPSHGFDGSGFVRWAREHLGAGAFNGHDLLDQPEHGAGCPSRNILGGWVGEGGGPTNGGASTAARPGGAPCVECAKWLEPRHLSQFVERNQVLRQPALKWAFFNVRPAQPRVCAPRPVWPWPSFRGPSPTRARARACPSAACPTLQQPPFLPPRPSDRSLPSARHAAGERLLILGERVGRLERRESARRRDHPPHLHGAAAVRATWRHALVRLRALRARGPSSP